MDILVNLVLGENSLLGLLTAAFLQCPYLDFSHPCIWRREVEKAGSLAFLSIKTLILSDSGPIPMISFNFSSFFSKYGHTGH